MIASSAALSTSVTKSFCCFLRISIRSRSRDAIDDLSGAARSLDSNVEHGMHEPGSVAGGTGRHEWEPPGTAQAWQAR